MTDHRPALDTLATTRRQFLAGALATAAAGLARGALRAAAPAASSALPFRIGAGAVEITPDRSMPMIGFAARTEPSAGAYQPLFVKALTIEDAAGGRLVLLHADLLFWDHAAGKWFDDRQQAGIIEGIRARLVASESLKPEQIFFVASHTHCGPTLGDADYNAGLIAKTAALVSRCLADARPARLYYGRGHSDIGVSRRAPDRNGWDLWEINPYGSRDPEVVIIKAVGEDGKPLAFAINYACHPTTIGGLLFGGDYAGFAMARIERDFPGATCLFLQGCGGDIKPHLPSADDPYKFASYAQVADASLAKHPEGVGLQLAADVTAALSAPMDEISGPVRSSLATVDLPILDSWINPDGSPELPAWITSPIGRADWPAHLADPTRRWARLAQLVSESRDGHGKFRQVQTGEVQVARIGDRFVHVGLPGEMTTPIGRRVKGQLRGFNALVTGYTNHSIGYFPAAYQIIEGGYEVFRNPTMHPYSPEAEDLLIGRAMELHSAAETAKA